MKTKKKISLGYKFSKGSAFIFVILLTTLLAVIGLMFLMTSRLSKVSTSSLSMDRELDNFAQTIVAELSQQLVLDTPGIDPAQEYSDYPDPNTDPWLASLEPYNDGSDYKWRHISDVTGYLRSRGFSTVNVVVDVPGNSKYVPEYPQIGFDSATGLLSDWWADADGDGIADSKWIELADVNTSTGRPVYAAIRVIDNGGMFNVNTAYKFYPFGDVNSEDIDGSSQDQINLIDLAKRGSNSNPEKTLNDDYRSPSGRSLSQYESDVIWDYDVPSSDYTPFDISDELELRYRYLINQEDIDNRIEELWDNCFQVSATRPYSADSSPIAKWQLASLLTNFDEYDFRHIATTYNMDRIINPFGERMVNVRNLPTNVPVDWAQKILYEDALLPCAIDDVQRAQFAQAAANIKDYADEDTEVTTVFDIPGNIPHYGYERPDIYISEIVIGYTYIDPCDPAKGYDPNEPNDPNLHRSYAIEIYNDFRSSDQFNDWQIVIDSPNLDATIPLSTATFQSRGGQYYVAIYEDDLAPLSDRVEWSDSPPDGATGVDPCVVLAWPPIWAQDANGVWVMANAYDVYFGTNLDAVRDANSSWPVGPVYQGRNNINYFDPFDSAPMDLGQTYYWRVAGVNTFDNTIIDDGQPPWSFTIWTEEPESVVDDSNSNEPPLFTADTIIRLERFVQGAGFIVVDMVGSAGAPDDRVIPTWLFDFNDAGWELRTRSFQRDLSDEGRLRRLWNLAVLPDCVQAGNFGSPKVLPILNSDSLGHHNYFYWPDFVPPIQSHQQRLNNVGELGFVFKKSTYYMDPAACLNRIQIFDSEYDIRLDAVNPAVQEMFKYLTVMDPERYHSDANEMRVQGRININTAPWYVLAQLPWVSIRESQTPTPALAEAIVAYRDRLTGSGGLDYTSRGGPPGFDNIGQLMFVNLPVPDARSSIGYYALDADDQKGYPDLTVNRRTKNDGHPDDIEERDLIFARISDLVTVRSDVFTAYILVRLGPNGPQRRFIAILDRSDVRSADDKVKVRALYPVPDPR